MDTSPRLATVLAACFVGCMASLPALAAPGDKVDLCHATGSGYKPLTVNANALKAHLGHGDVVQPNGQVPGSPGHVFDAKCSPVTWGYASGAGPDVSAQTPQGNLLVGSGIPATHFGVARNEAAGIELGLQVIYRQGPTVASIDNYDDGVLQFAVASGPQSTANGSFANHTGRAAWNFNYSVATGLNGTTTNLASYTFQLQYDVDPGPGTSFRTLTMESGGAGSSGYRWKDQGTGLFFISDDAGNANVTQNSQNYAFSFVQNFLTSAYGPSNNFAGPGSYEIVLQAFDGPQLIARNRIVVNVAHPAP